MAILDDKSIIHKFVMGEGELLANKNLRVEPAFDTNQLLSRTGELVAITKPNIKIRGVSVNLRSKFWDLTHQVLLQDSFVPLGQTERQGIMQWEQHEIPAGYKVNFTTAKALWRVWWIHHTLHNQRRIQIDILVLTRSIWFPLREIAYNPDELYLKTLVGELRLHHNDNLVWLSRSQNTEGKVQIASIQTASASVPHKLTSPIDSLQQSWAENIRPIAIRVFNKCADAGKAQEVKPGLWLVKGAYYDLVYQTQTASFGVVGVQRGVLFKFREETLELAANLTYEDIKYWEKINEDLEQWQ